MRKRYHAIVRYFFLGIRYYAGWQGNAIDAVTAGDFVELAVRRLQEADKVETVFCCELAGATSEPAELTYSVAANDLEDRYLTLVILLKKPKELTWPELRKMLNGSLEEVGILLGMVHARIGLCAGITDWDAESLPNGQKPADEPGKDMQEEILQTLERARLPSSFNKLWERSGHYKKTAFAFGLGWMLAKGKIKRNEEGNWTLT